MANTETILDRQPPHNRDAEMAVIGSLLLYPDACDDVAAHLDAEDFFDDANRRLYGHIQALHNSSGKVDPVLLSDHLKAEGDFECCGGAAYLYQVSSTVPNGAHAIYYAKIVAENGRRRRMILACTETLRDCYDMPTGETIDDVISRAETAVMAVRDSKRQDTIRPIGDVLTQALAELDARIKGEATVATPTGFSDLDKLLGGGFRAGQLVILAARTSVGKSAFGASIKVSTARHGKGVYVSSLEMAATELVDRTLAAASKVDGNRMRAGTINPTERGKIASASSGLSQLPIWYDDASTQRVGDIAAGARRAARRAKVPLGMIVVDYLQLIDTETHWRESRQEQVARIARRLKALARERRVTVLALCQLNRDAEDSSRPKLHHLRESGAIEQDADVVLLMSRDTAPNTIVVDVAKQRNGPLGDIRLVFNGAMATFLPAAAPNRQTEGHEYGTGDELQSATDEDPLEQRRITAFDDYNRGEF